MFTNYIFQARVKSLLRVVAEQSEIRPSLTSLTSFTSNIDIEDVYCSNYSISGASNITSIKTPGGNFTLGNFYMRDSKKYLSYVDDF